MIRKKKSAVVGIVVKALIHHGLKNHKAPQLIEMKKGKEKKIVD